MPILVIILAVAASIAAGFLSVTAQPGLVFLSASVILVSLLAFLSPKMSVVLLVFSMLLSPEIGFGAVSSSRSAVLRYDDILLVVIFFSWFARTAIFKDKAFITATPVQVPVLLYTVIAVVSTGLAIIRGEIRAEIAGFYVLKYVEYFFLYFMLVNIIDSREEMKKYLKYAGFVAFIVTLYAYYYYLNSGASARASAPFEAPLGNAKDSEPASLGGYYLLVFGFVMALMTEVPGPMQLLLAGSMVFMFPAFLLTFSRSSYLGFAVMVPVMVFLSRRRKAFLTFFLCAGVVAVALTPGLSDKVRERITTTYQGSEAVNTVQLGAAGQVKLEDSAAARVGSINRAIFDRLPVHPILGWGVTGIGIGDTQYALVLGEMGLAGFFTFLWMLYSIFSTARKVYRAYEEPWIKAVSLGLMASIAGLVFQAVGVNNFIIVRIMEPFWFLTAIVMALYRGAGQEAKPGTV
ncbi:MAG: hypothetical protein WCW52_06060 [Elusimicrobiales bacterium]|jgi:hypothetical protein